MSGFKHAYMLLATDFELEPVIEQYLSTYPDAQPREYQVVCKLQNERHEGDYCYIVVYEHVTGGSRFKLPEYIKSYCEVNNKVATMTVSGNVFPDIAQANYGDTTKYHKK
jgi:hypothetical protein